MVALNRIESHKNKAKQSAPHSGVMQGGMEVARAIDWPPYHARLVASDQNT